MAANIALIQVAEWASYPWLRHGFSPRAGGETTAYGANDLNLGFTPEDARATVEENRRLAVDAINSEAQLATVRQVHGATIIRVAEPQANPLEADGMLTSLAGVVLGIQVADCVPVLLADTRLRVVAALHAGWRGTVAGIAGLGVARMVDEFGSRPEDLIAAVGPSIGPCCYEVGDELIDRVGWEAGLLERRDGAVFFNLWEANRRQLAAGGVDRVTVLELCTACSRTGLGQRRFFSHRAEGGVTGRAMGLIGLV